MSKNTQQLKKHRAITLIELLIYLAITAIVLIVIIDLVARIGQNRNQSMGQGEVTQNSRFLSERLTFAIQSASSIDGSYPADNLNLTINGGTITFSLSGGQIFYQEGANPALPLSSEQVEISPILGENIFSKITNGNAQSVQIKFKVKFKQNDFSQDFETSVLARGK